MAEWTAGTGALTRVLYRDGAAVGMVDSPEVAAEIVEALNGRLRALAPAGCGCPVTLSSVRTTSHTRECSGRQAAERIAADIEADEAAESGRERSPELNRGGYPAAQSTGRLPAVPSGPAPGARERSHAEQAAAGRRCYCPSCSAKRGRPS